jgi:dihydrolipoamide dehydrogenase
VAVGATAGRFTGSSTLGSGALLTLLSDGERLTGAFGLGADADAWVQQLVLAVRARVSLDVLRDTIQSSQTFFALCRAALHALLAAIGAGGGDA